jgi:3-hydroxyisobutyrate dehydrogenase-like beta-hydroxyacid dehydrogenase
MMAKVGYVGLGAMGGRMAARLLAAGHGVVGYNRTRSKAEWLTAHGIELVDTPRAVCERADFIFCMVTDSRASQAVTAGPDGMLAGLSAGKVVIDMSTISPAVSRRLADDVRARGADMVDAPVSGSITTLEQGKLSIMVGGRPETFARGSRCSATSARR